MRKSAKILWNRKSAGLTEIYYKKSPSLDGGGKSRWAVRNHSPVYFWREKHGK